MKALRSFSLLLGLVVAIAVSVSGTAHADCGNKSKQKTKAKTTGMKGMEDMQDEDMPMCCMRMKHQEKMKGHTEETEEGSGDAGMGSMGTEPVKDPVCSMAVDPRTAEKSAYKGKTYYFCGEEDKERFERSPEKYVKQRQPVPREP